MNMSHPTLTEFNSYASSYLEKLGDDPKKYTEYIQCKYDAWSLAGWKKEIKGKPVKILNWKNTLIQAMPYRQPNKVKDLTVRAEPITTGKVKKIENEEILTAYRDFRKVGSTSPKFVGIFNILRRRGKLPGREDINPKTGKKCALYYDRRAQDAVKNYPTLNREALEKKAKCLVLEDYFKKI